MAFTDDFNPIVGEYRNMPGYYVCVVSTGFTLGPMLARLLADHLESNGTSALPEEYAPDRVIEVASK